MTISSGGWGLWNCFQLAGAVGALCGLVAMAPVIATGTAIAGFAWVVGVIVAVTVTVIGTFLLDMLDKFAQFSNNASNNPAVQVAQKSTSFVGTATGKVVTGATVLAFAGSATISGIAGTSTPTPTPTPIPIARVVNISTPTMSFIPATSTPVPPTVNPKLIPMPTVVGMSLDDAVKTLKAKGFQNYTWDDGCSDKVKQGLIYLQQPAANTPVDPANTMPILYRNRGPYPAAICPTETPTTKSIPTLTPTRTATPTRTVTPAARANDCPGVTLTAKQKEAGCDSSSLTREERANCGDRVYELKFKSCPKNVDCSDYDKYPRMGEDHRFLGETVLWVSKEGPFQKTAPNTWKVDRKTNVYTIIFSCTGMIKQLDDRSGHSEFAYALADYQP